MLHSAHTVIIIWSGTINNLNQLEREPVRIFQNIGVDDVQGVIGALDFSNVSAVIGAPGIAMEIRQLIPVPLIVAYPTYIDILETVKEVELRLNVRNKKIALILHEGNKIQEDRLDYFISNTIELYKYESKPQMRQIFQRIADKGYALVIGGPTVARMAAEYGMEAVQIVYREQALLDALEKTREMLLLMDKELGQLERLKALLDIIPDGIIETDAAGTVTLCNKKTLEMLELSYDKILGRNVCQLLGDTSWEHVYRHSASQVDTLFGYGKNKYFSTRQPILKGTRITGSVGTLQAASKIQTMESKYRSQQNKGLEARHTFADIIGESRIMREVVERVRLYTRTDSTVLLEGETGTGKEIFAQSIHNGSRRSSGPFVAINCAAIAETLLESELMGYDEGAFTGARKGGKMGLFERAHKGTIFLDEVNQLPLRLQAKLLRVIQEKAVMRVGGDGIIPVDVRIIAATNENLNRKVANHTFRSDLYYRLNVLNVRLPPLRERPEDIAQLMTTFAARFTENTATLPARVKAMTELVSGHGWPGNIRELQNVVERYMILGASVSQLDKYFFHEFQGDNLETDSAACDMRFAVTPDTLENMTSALVCAMVERCGGNKSRAALRLGISRNTLHQRLKTGSGSASD